MESTVLYGHIFAIFFEFSEQFTIHFEHKVYNVGVKECGGKLQPSNYYIQ